MNHDDPRHRSPPRAEPLQPDRPSRGSGREADRSGTAPAKGQQGDIAGSAEKLKQQSEDAVDNVREGYGGAPAADAAGRRST
ncbi:MAG TPA: hypothetical protein VIN03_03275 [Roseateles sp.]